MSQQDTYRKHPKPEAFNATRDALVCRLNGMIGKAGLTGHGIRRKTGIDFDKVKLNRLLNGDLTCFSDNMLFLLYERLGGRLSVTLH